MGLSIKDVRTLVGGGGSSKSAKMWTGGRVWLAKCGRLLGKKVKSTIFVKFTVFVLF